MTAIAAADVVERFRAAVAARLGLQFDDGRLGWLGEVLRRRTEAARLSAEAYLARLEAQPTPADVELLARDLTVAETYFYRHVEQFRALADVVLPARLARRPAGSPLRLLSLGCASGEEPYTLAMVVVDALGPAAPDVSVLGVDVNPDVLEQASRGRFSAWSLRETPPPDRQRWFRTEGRSFVLDEAVRALVRFEQRNLVDEDPLFWRDEIYDVVFFRNVIMYFAPEQARAAIARVARSLRPGGYLFLGHAETLRGLSTAFHLVHTHGTFYYQKKQEGVGCEVAPAQRPAASPLSGVDAGAWVESIHRAVDRVAALIESARRTGGPIAPSDAGRSAASGDESAILELLRRERYGEALDAMEVWPPEQAADPDALLIRAVLLVHRGDLAGAEQTCRRLLALDELNAGAHYLLALCREAAGDRPAAVHHDQAAAYLDPGFAMPRLHLGLLARRTGELAAARRELEAALALLHREDASRLLLFGGGFSRDALAALCRSELVACGGRP